MLFEVYAGSKPGRPRLLLTVTAGLLAGALGVAWLQVRTTAGLGAEQRIADTPLRVRLPHGWRVDPQNPGRFLLPIADRERRSNFEFERQIRFEFVRLPSFVSLETLMRLPVLSSSGEVRSIARLGAYPAVESQKIEARRSGRQLFLRETITRFTCLPRGQLIKVVYEPLTELRPTDRDIFNEVCASLRVDDPTLSAPADEYLRRAGIKLPLDPEWQVVGPDFEETQGVYVGGLVDGVPGWSLAVFRTWLAFGRTPRDLLVDFAGQHWLAWDVAGAIREQSRGDGATVTALQHPQFGRADPLVAAVWVVAQTPARVAIIFVQAGAKEAAAADRAAARVAAGIEMESLAAVADIAAAEAAGSGLVGDLQNRGPAPRWGREVTKAIYKQAGHEEMVVVQRGAVDRDPNRGYQGTLSRGTNRSQREGLSWTLDAQAGAYSWQTDFFRGRAQVHVEERRATATGEVVRQVYLDERRAQLWRFTPGPAFVAPPADGIIKGWVARGERPAAIIEVSTELGPNTHTVLLQQLPADGAYPRVLVRDDYWPLGGIEAYDDSQGDTQYEIYPNAEYRRVK